MQKFNILLKIHSIYLVFPQGTRAIVRNRHVLPLGKLQSSRLLWLLAASAAASSGADDVVGVGGVD